jgi:DNA mismatch repair protein MutS
VPKKKFIIEVELFEQLVSWITTYIKPVQMNANLVAQLDCLCSFTQLANKYVCVLNWTKHSIKLKRKASVIEKQLPVGMPYIANDVFLDKQQLIMITGPNMESQLFCVKPR